MNRLGGQVPVDEVALGDADLLPGDLLPRRRPLRQRAEDRDQRVGADFLVRAPPQVVVDDVDLVAEVGEPHRGRPPEVSVATQDQDSHVVRVPFRGIGPCETGSSYRRPLCACPPSTHGCGASEEEAGPPGGGRGEHHPDPAPAAERDADAARGRPAQDERGHAEGGRETEGRQAGTRRATRTPIRRR